MHDDDDYGQIIPRELFSTGYAQSLPDILKDHHEKLKSIAFALDASLDLESHLAEVSKGIESGKITSFDIEDLNLNRLLSGDMESRQIYRFQMCCIALTCAQDRIASGHAQTAWPLLCHNSYLIGTIEDGLALAAKAEEHQKKLQKSIPNKKKGGNVTKEKYDKIRAQMIALLTSRAPSGGWGTKKQAVDTIYSELQDFISEASLGLLLPDIHATATKWLQKSGNAEINEAYLANAAKNQTIREGA